MWPKQVDGSIWTNRRRLKYGPVFGDRTGLKSLDDTVRWVLSCPLILPRDSVGAVISHIVIGPVEIPEQSQHGVSQHHKDQRRA